MPPGSQQQTEIIIKTIMSATVYMSSGEESHMGALQALIQINSSIHFLHTVSFGKTGTFNLQ